MLLLSNKTLHTNRSTPSPQPQPSPSPQPQPHSVVAKALDQEISTCKSFGLVAGLNWSVAFVRRTHEAKSRWTFSRQWQSQVSLLHSVSLDLLHSVSLDVATIHLAMKSCICDHLDALKEPYPFWCTALLSTGVSASGHIKGMRMSGEWMSAIELRAAAIVFGINMFVFSKESNLDVIWGREKCYLKDSTLLECAQ
ncbi:hypothetical protein L596_026936 [Steinernema carpocapsae]|nr:hypothetical protein L596_026936 [Steinernema carpocapsae]